MTKKSFCFAIITNEWKFVEIHIEFLLSSFFMHCSASSLSIASNWLSLFTDIWHTKKRHLLSLVHSCEKAKNFVLFFIFITIFLFSFNFFRLLKIARHSGTKKYMHPLLFSPLQMPYSSSLEKWLLFIFFSYFFIYSILEEILHKVYLIVANYSFLKYHISFALLKRKP